MLYIFTKSTVHAGGSRHRAFFVADFLRRNGHVLQLVVPPVYRTDVTRLRARMVYVRTIFSLRKDDTVLLQNPIFSTYFIICIALVKILFRPTLVFDFDDATWVQNPIAPRVLAFFSDKYIVASHALATWLPLRGKPVMIMPNLVDFEIAAQVAPPSDANEKERRVVLGWIGSGPLSMHNLEILVPVFKRLIEDNTVFTFKLVGLLTAQYPDKHKELLKMFDIPGIHAEYVDVLEWQKKGEIQKANASFDIGLCPLVDNESNRNRCSLKVLDYMAAGIPVAISPVGENIYFVDEAKSGFLPLTTEEWVRDLKKLITDARLRQTMGRAGLEKLKREYSYQRRIGEYEKFLGLK